MKLLGLIEAPEDLVTKKYVDENFARKGETHSTENKNNIPEFFSKTYLEEAYDLRWVAIPKDVFEEKLEVDTFYALSSGFWREIQKVDDYLSGYAGTVILCVADKDDKYWFINNGTLTISPEIFLIKGKNPGTSSPTFAWGPKSGITFIVKK